MVGTIEPQAGGEALPPALCDAFVARARPMRVRARQILIAEGTNTTEVFLVRTGRVRFSLSARGGREVALRELGPGAVFGELAALDRAMRSVDVSAVVDSELACLSADAFLDYLNEVPSAGLWIARQLAGRVRNLTEATSELATLPVSGRVQAELLRLAGDAPGDRTAITMPTHANIASRIGTHREAVTRELNLLAREGIFRQTGREAEIVSIARLRVQLERIGRT